VVEEEQSVEVAAGVGLEGEGGDGEAGEDFRGADERWDVNGRVPGVRWSALKLSVRREDILLKRSIWGQSHAMAIPLGCVPRSLICEARWMT
jgi:hypothetical protein